MKLMPYRKFSIKTSKTNEEIRQIIITNTVSKRPSLFGASSNKPFWGRATDKYFVLTPVIYYMNSFVPTIKLSISENIDGTIVNAKMRLQIAVVIFMCFWLGLCIIFELMLIAGIANTGFDIFDMTPAAMFVFGYCLMYFSFRFEADKAEKKLGYLLGDIKEKKHKLRNPTKKNKKLKTGLIIMSVPLILVGFFGFSMSVVQNNDDISKYYSQRPLNEKSGLAVDSSGNIYVGEREAGVVQVYNKTGVFQYGFSFPTGGSGWFCFGIFEDKIHLVTAREDSYLVFDKGELISGEKIDNVRSQKLQKTYNMNDGNYYNFNNEEYMMSTFNTVTVKDESGKVVEKIQLKDVPVWPFPNMAYWLMLAVGLIPYFSVVCKAVFTTSKIRQNNS